MKRNLKILLITPMLFGLVSCSDYPDELTLEQTHANAATAYFFNITDEQIQAIEAQGKKLSKFSRQAEQFLTESTLKQQCKEIGSELLKNALCKNAAKYENAFQTANQKWLADVLPQEISQAKERLRYLEKDKMTLIQKEQKYQASFKDSQQALDKIRSEIESEKQTAAKFRKEIVSGINADILAKKIPITTLSDNTLIIRNYDVSEQKEGEECTTKVRHRNWNYASAGENEQSNNCYRINFNYSLNKKLIPKIDINTYKTQLIGIIEASNKVSSLNKERIEADKQLRNDIIVAKNLNPNYSKYAVERDKKNIESQIKNATQQIAQLKTQTLMPTKYFYKTEEGNKFRSAVKEFNAEQIVIDETKQYLKGEIDFTLQNGFGKIKTIGDATKLIVVTRLSKEVPVNFFSSEKTTAHRYYTAQLDLTNESLAELDVLKITEKELKNTISGITDENVQKIGGNKFVMELAVLKALDD